MKKSLRILACLVITVLISSIAFSNVLLATETANTCTDNCEHAHDENLVDGQEIQWIGEAVIEVDSEEEFLSYSKNPLIKYSFIIKSPVQSRAICPRCVSNGLGLYSRITQQRTVAKGCPDLMSSALSDHWNTWWTYGYEKCGYCGYKSAEWFSFESYTASCRNMFIEKNEYEVRYEYTMAAGYNLHNSLRYWRDGLWI